MVALLLIDIQRDFMPGGPLGVAGGDEVVPVANRLMRRYPLVVATQDWHPADHGSFAAQHPGRAPGTLIDLFGLTQVLWPVHCVQGTPGAEFTEGLDVQGIHHVVRKGMDRRVDSYSGFFDNGGKNPSGLTTLLREKGVTDVVIVGVATDYCVRFTAQDARSEGFGVTLVVDGCRGVELAPGDVGAALEHLAGLGVRIVDESAL